MPAWMLVRKIAVGLMLFVSPGLLGGQASSRTATDAPSFRRTSSQAVSTQAVSAHAALAQTASPQTGSTQTVQDVLHHLSARAGVIFLGQVIAIEPPGPSASSGVAEIRFRVDTAIRGCSSTAPYVLREWGGLWAADGHRYRVGDRLLMFLYAPGPSGMSSPVEGLNGAVPVRQASSADAAVAAGPYVDLRWLGARLERGVAYPQQAPVVRSSDVQPASQFLSQGVQTLGVVRAGLSSRAAAITLASVPAPAADSDSGSSIPAEQASVPYVLDLLTTWQRQPDAAQ